MKDKRREMNMSQAIKLTKDLRELILQTDWGGVAVTKGAFREALQALIFCATSKSKLEKDKSKYATVDAVVNSILDLKDELLTLIIRNKMEIKSLKKLSKLELGEEELFRIVLKIEYPKGLPVFPNKYQVEGAALKDLYPKEYQLAQAILQKIKGV